MKLKNLKTVIETVKQLRVIETVSERRNVTMPTVLHLGINIQVTFCLHATKVEEYYFAVIMEIFKAL